MADGIIDMHDMETIFSVTDALGIHRESVSVELTKEDPGLVQLGSDPSPDSDPSIEITIPATGTVEEFAQRLQSELEQMGYVVTELEEDEED
jgi:hypothetical protein